MLTNTELIRRLDLFEGLDAKQIELIEQLCIVRKFAAGEYLIRQGESGLGLHFITGGRVKIEIERNVEVPEGRKLVKVVLNELTEGGVVGEFSIIDDNARSANVICLEETQCLLLTRESFSKLLKEHPEIAVSMLKSLVARIRSTNERTSKSGSHPDNAAGRLHEYPSAAPCMDLERSSRKKRNSVIDWLRRIGGSGSGAEESAERTGRRSQGQIPNSQSRNTLEPPAVMDRIHFSITCPPLMELGSSHLIDIWAHLEQQRAQVIERAREEARKDIRIKSKGPFRVERGTILTVRLQVEDLAVDPVEDTILWEGEIGNATFTVTVEGSIVQGPRPGVARIYANGFQVARISFIVQVGATSVMPECLQAEERRVRAAFASYASEDQDAVLVRIQSLRKALPGLNVFFARKDLKSGHKWQEKLAHEIMSRDVMYLFWSQAAKDSTWVDWEWRYGLRNRGIDFIDPFPLAPPDAAPPPRELAAVLHFGDWELDYIRESPMKSQEGRS